MRRSSSLFEALWLRIAAPATGVVFAIAVAGAIVLTSPNATANSALDSDYGYDRTWNAALRMLRVDLGLKVVEKDEANGYLLFEYHSSESGNKVSQGSLELVRAKDGDGPIHVIVQLPQMPRYHEQVIVDQLQRKMRMEYGDPPPHKAPAPPPADAGTE